MNTEKTLTDKFAQMDEYPIWYYKVLEPASVDYVISNLLKESFVVDIDGFKHEVTFGKNKNGEIGRCIKYDTVTNSNLCSYEVINKGFTVGNWFRITDIDTSVEFKSDYNQWKTEIEEESKKELYKLILNSAINKELDEEIKTNIQKRIAECTCEELELMMKQILK